MRASTKKWAKRRAELERRKRVDGPESAAKWSMRFRADRLHKLFV